MALHIATMSTLYEFGCGVKDPWETNHLHSLVLLLFQFRRPLKGMGFRRCLLVLYACKRSLVRVGNALSPLSYLTPNLDSFVSFAREQTRTRHVKGGAKDTGLTVEGTRLQECVPRLKVVPRLPVPEVHGPIVA